MLDTHAATWSIAGLATLGVIARPWNLPEYIWAVAGAVLLVAFDLLPWRDAMAAAAKGAGRLDAAERLADLVVKVAGI